MTVFEIMTLVVPVVDALMIFILFEALFKRRERFPDGVYGVSAILLAVLLAVVDAVVGMEPLKWLATVLVVMVFSLSYEARLSYRMKTVIFGTAVLFVTESAAVVLMRVLQMILPAPVPEFRLQECAFFGLMAFKMLGFILCNEFGKKHCGDNQRKDGTYWLSVVLLCTSAVVAIFLLTQHQNVLHFEWYRGLAVFAGVGLFLGTVLTFYLYGRLERQSVALREREQREQYLQSQLKHLNELLFKQKELNGFKHDISNQLLALKGYFSAGDNNGGLQHIHSLLELVEEKAPAIDTGNIALDAILSTKQAMAEDKGISFDAHVRISENLSIDPVDLSVIFGNALDNAIEACERLTAGEKCIVLELRQQDNALVCQLANTAPPRAQRTLATSKTDKDNHGYGFANLTASIEKYGGEPVVNWENGWFILTFMLFMKKKYER